MQFFKTLTHLKTFIVTLTLILFVGNLGFAQFNIPEIPKEQTSVYDYVGLLSNNEKSNLERKLIKYSDTTSTQIVVAIIGSTNGENIGLLTPRWAHQWGIGQAKEDNGVFILLARDDRKIWISPGYGVEDRLTAGIVGEIVRNVIIPEFKSGDYYQGLNKGTDAIFDVLNGAYKGTRKTDTKKDNSKFFFILIIIIFIVIALSKNKRGGGNNHRGGNRHGGFDIWDAIILSNMGRGGFGGSSGGGFSGGGGFGGGFGGGGFSGGGAGGSW
ncbi:TPM domain-containing protein [Aestuariibaculum lutulentum]|uniref:TPM domain-containing protein n=1 Tax=Aestuariibaculum lutulentum TaxID=2920935 RepID=A0ABS9RM59_9FLAO|nr:TPM domain-containing protein [Aestuariibaculum lutulentum]MCH4554039.1 TPM domain-containing protein [Aestuariibaculum lutulentum]